MTADLVKLLREVRALLDDAERRQVLREGWTGDLRPNALEDGERMVLPAGADRDLPRILLALDVAIRAGAS